MTQLDKVSIRVTPLSSRIVLARFGKDPHTALETRDATSEFLKALVSYAFDGREPAFGEAVEIKFGAGDKQFTCTVKREREP